jgi:hypothetical protein
MIMAMKRLREDAELPEDDGMYLLRREIQGIWWTFSKHEDRAAALRQIAMRGGRINNRGEPKPQRPCKPIIAEHNVEPKLRDLPVELVENIASYLDRRSFTELRLTGRAMRDGSNHAFLKRFFRTRTVMLEWESLRKLAVIVAQSGLRGAVKHIVFLVEGDVRFLNDELSLQEVEHAMDTPVPPDWTPATCPKAKSWLYLLERSFSSLRELRGLTFRAKEGYALSSHAIAMVFAAAASSGLKVQEMNLGGEDADRCGDFCDYRGRVGTVLKRESSSLKRVFAGVKRLELLWYCGDDVPACSMTNTLLPLTPNLETLVVWDVDGRNRFDYLDSLQSPLSKLKNLELHYSCIEKMGRYAKCVVGFVRRWARGATRIDLFLSGKVKVRDGERFAEGVRRNLDGVRVSVSGGRVGSSSILADSEDEQEVEEVEED